MGLCNIHSECRCQYLETSTMKLCLVLLGLVVVEVAGVLVVAGLKAENDATEARHGGSDKGEAYVTLLYGNYLLSVRVLGLSLKLSGTQHEMVVLCTEDVPEENRRILEGDGWTVKSIKTTSSPYENHLERFDNVFTKLSIWTLTEYRRIVYLDSDTVVYANIDELFHCGKFCAAYRHSDLFNSGVLVVKPDILEYHKLISKVGLYPSYDGADEGFLNYYYHSLLFAPMFNASNPHNEEEPMRLPAGYNADVGQYYVHTDRFFPITGFKVLHHAMGPVKPWRWWTYPIFSLTWHWVELRDNLQPSTDRSVYILFAATFSFMLLSVMSICMRHFNISKPTWLVILKHDSFAFSAIVALILPLSCIFGFCCVPCSVHPHVAIPSFCLWTTIFLHVSHFFVHILTSTSEVYRLPLSNSTIFISVLLFASLVVPLYVSSFFTRVCVFLALIILCYVYSNFIIRRCLVDFY